MNKQLAMRLLVTSKHYDLATPMYSVEYRLDHVAAPLNRITYLDFKAGHNAFDTKENLKLLTRTIREFVVGK